MNKFTENEKDYPEKVIKKEDEEEKISDTTNVKKSKIAFNYDNKKKISMYNSIIFYLSDC